MLEGNAVAVGNVNTNGCSATITGIEEGVTPFAMPDWSGSILSKAEIMPTIQSDAFISSHNIVANGFYYTEDSVTINAASFTGDAVIVSKGDITYNVESLNDGEEPTGRILLYSEEGDITINGSKIVINGILYAPCGSVYINAYDTTINGRIVADGFRYNGSILNIYSDPSDLQLLNELPDVRVTALQESVEVGENASFRIDIPEDNVFDIFYRLNGEDVTINIPDSEYEDTVFTFTTEEEGEYTFEVYVCLPYGEFVLDTATVNVIQQITPTTVLSVTVNPTVTPTETIAPTNTPTPTVTIIPTASNTPVPTDTPTNTPTNLPVFTDTPTPTIFETPIPTTTETPSVTNIPSVTVTPTSAPTIEITLTPTETVDPD